MMFQVGDLVRKYADTEYEPHAAGVGLVIEIRLPDQVRVKWSGNYGTFWGTFNGIKPISDD